MLLIRFIDSLPKKIGIAIYSVGIVLFLGCLIWGTIMVKDIVLSIMTTTSFVLIAFLLLKIRYNKKKYGVYYTPTKKQFEKLKAMRDADIVEEEPMGKKEIKWKLLFEYLLLFIIDVAVDILDIIK